MEKEVFTQEFEKCFTVFQQVQLIKKFLIELDIYQKVLIPGNGISIENNIISVNYENGDERSY